MEQQLPIFLMKMLPCRVVMEPMLLMSDTTATSDDNNVEDDDHIHDTVCRGAGHCRPCVSTGGLASRSRARWARPVAVRVALNNLN